jgi:hypothetical protein
VIPKILHQTWKSRDLPPKYARWSESFRRHLPDWEYRFWDDDACLGLVKESYPQYLDTYLGLRNPAERSDLFRYMVLHRFGGMYADIDCECRRPLDFIDPSDEFIVATELNTRSLRIMRLYRSDLPKLYCQWTFLSAPGHPILTRLIEDIARHAQATASDDPIINVLKRTGPHAFTRAILSHIEAGGSPVRILPAAWFGAPNSSNTLNFSLTFLFPELFRRVYVRHHFEMSWMDAKTKRDMVIKNLFLVHPK